MNANKAFIKKERWVKLASVLTLLVLFFWVIFAVDNMMSSVVLALVFTYLLNPFVKGLESRGFARTTSVLIPFLATAFLVGLIVSLFYPVLSGQFSDLQAEIPKYQAGLTDIIQKFDERTQDIFQGYYSIDLGENLSSLISTSASTIFNNIPDLASKLVSVLLLAPFFCFFMLRDGRKLVRQFLKMMPNNLFELALNLNYQINMQMGDFIRARLLEAGIVGLVIWIGLAMIGFPYAFILAAFAALTNLIPYVGPFIGAIPAIAIGLINNDPGITIFLVALTYLIAQLIDIIFIIPMVVAKIVNLHPVFVVVVIIIGSQLMGILGMVISIPVASALKLTITAVYDHIIYFRS